MEITLRACAKLINALKIDLSIILVGKDEHPKQKNMLHLKKVIKELGLESNVNFTGQVKNKQIPKIIRSANIIIDSRLVGNYSSVILESLAMGSVIVASDTPGNKEFITPEVNGLLYKKGDSNSLFMILTNLITNFELQRSLSNGAKEWFHSNFKLYSLENHIDDLINIYKN